MLLVRTTRAATSRATRCASSPARAATRRRPGSTRCSPRSSSRSRSSARRDFDCAPGLRLPARAAAPPAIDYLAKDYRRLPPADARPARAARARLDASATPPTSASRSSSCSPTSPTSCPTARTRSPPRPTSAPRAAARRCAATRGSSTTSCTKAATPAPGCASSSAAQGVALDRRHGAADPGPDTPDALSRAGPSTAPRSPPTRRRSRPSSRAVLYATHERFEFWTWGDAGCCLPRGRDLRDASSATTRR